MEEERQPSLYTALAPNNDPDIIKALLHEWKLIYHKLMTKTSLIDVTMLIINNLINVIQFMRLCFENSPCYSGAWSSDNKDCCDTLIEGFLWAG